MSKMKATSVAAFLAGAVSLGGLAVQAQAPTPATSQQAGESGPSCYGGMHGMMTMMRDHMGAGMMGPWSDMGGGMMGPWSDMGGGMMGPGASASPGMMTPGASMGPGRMGPAYSPGAMHSTGDECVALMGQMMGMMRDHMSAGMMGPAPTTAPSPDPHDAHHPSTTRDPGVPSESASA